MCYHTALAAGPAELARRFGRRDDRIRDFRPVYHVSAFSHAEYPIVTAEPELEPARWGLIPFWTDTLEDAIAIRNRTLNARAETIFSKPSFRKAIRECRCLVPVTGFFEWQQAGNRKIPYYITLREEGLFALAGICDKWHNETTGEEVRTYSVVTTRANRMLSAINNRSCRMPVILPVSKEQTWLDPGLSEEQIARMLCVYPGRTMEATAIDPGFLKKSPYDPALLQPREAVEA